MSSMLAHLNHVVQSRDPAIDLRRAKRDLVDMASQMVADGFDHPIRIINISPLGLMGRCDGAFATGDHVTVSLPMLDDYPADIRWNEDGRVGMEFLTPVEPDIYARLIALMPPRQTAW
ncbi:PilZ domain-containing protein [Sphingobium sp.]|uniref:PilZ domain-containing protein n=1 Tax=Sphingobium sp. TaxID=1912891 RepID=UPI003BB7A533